MNVLNFHIDELAEVCFSDMATVVIGYKWLRFMADDVTVTGIYDEEFEKLYMKTYK